MERTSRRAALIERVAHLPLFAGLERRALARVAEDLDWLAIPGGTELFHEDDPPDAVYVLIAGSLGAFKEIGGRLELIGRVAPGETVGEMALLSGHRRSATIRALRDSEVARFSRAAFERLARLHPEAMLAIARVAVARLERSLDAQRQNPPPRTLAMLPAHEGIDVDAWASALCTALARFGSVACLRQAEHRASSSAEWHRIEQDHRFLCFVGVAGETAWNERCRRQADCVLLLADARRTPSSLQLPAPTSGQGRALVLLQPGRIVPGVARAWRERLGVGPPWHLRNREDCERLARRLARRSIGVVFSGGGARGFAHIGAIRAMREAGLVIDAVGGTSIGALIAAAVALEWDDDTLQQTFHRAFVATHPLNDYTLPLVSLVAGRKASRLIRREFGEGDIEDLPLPFYCVSADLSDARAVVHDGGALWRALRASIAIPGILPPVASAGRLLVDGGVIDNLPVAAMRAVNPGPVIALDVAGHHALASTREETDSPPAWRLLLDHWRGERRPGLLQILLRAGMVNSAVTAEQHAALSDLLLKLPVDHIDLLGWRHFEEAIAAGYAATRARLAEGVPW
jgi:NTE family protein